MNRRRPQPARPNQTDHPAPASASAFDEELAQAFFRDGQSEDALVAATEREQERELSASRARGGARFIYAAAALGIGAAAFFYLAPKAFTETGFAGLADAPAVAVTATPTNEPPVLAATVAAPAPPAPAATAETAVVEDNELAAPLPSDEAAAPGAPASNAALATAANASSTLSAAGAIAAPSAEAAAPQGDPAAVLPENVVPSRATAPRATVSVRDLRGRTTPTATTAGDETARALALPPSDLLAEAAPRSPTQDALDACARLLRRGRFSDIKISCGQAFSAEPNAALAVQVARHALEHERYTDAQTWSRKAISVDDAHSEAFVTLGGAEHGLGHRALARTAYARYLELDPQGQYADDVRALIDSL